jgi:uncharacterized protein YbbK (DUF523 family)
LISRWRFFQNNGTIERQADPRVEQAYRQEKLMELILVSACLLGEKVRYNGGDKRCDDPILQRWLQEGRVVPVCPEVAGGLPTPRAPAEIAEGAGGLEVLRQAARVMDATGRDVSEQFRQGAGQALQLIRSKGIRIAILKEGSPSCGTGYTYDGSFTGKKVEQPGVAAGGLREAGVRVFNEAQLCQADKLLKLLEPEEAG